jgi:hypothetical protein
LAASAPRPVGVTGERVGQRRYYADGREVQRSGDAERTTAGFALGSTRHVGFMADDGKFPRRSRDACEVPRLSPSGLPAPWHPAAQATVFALGL